HDPTLMDPDPARREIRIDFLCRAIDIARQLDAECVSLWSGKLSDEITEDEAMDRLTGALGPVLAHAEKVGVPLAFEPEPGMFIDTMARFERLDRRIDHPLFQLTIDVGHLYCIEQEPVPAHLLRWGPRIINMHIEDMVKGVHEHLMFGEGTLDFLGVFQTLRQIGYSRGVHVELSRHSHEGARAARRAVDFLHPLAQAGEGTKLGSSEPPQKAQVQRGT
ncbi:MAG: sugar phosphate isomerase/epimerase family protein, partial [Isosphaeraceae bacterium]